MYLAMKLRTDMDLEPVGLALPRATLKLPQGCVGYTMVFDSAQAARDLYGDDVGLIQVAHDSVSAGKDGAR